MTVWLNPILAVNEDAETLITLVITMIMIAIWLVGGMLRTKTTAGPAKRSDHHRKGQNREKTASRVRRMERREKLANRMAAERLARQGRISDLVDIPQINPEQPLGVDLDPYPYAEDYLLAGEMLSAPPSVVEPESQRQQTTVNDGENRHDDVVDSSFFPAGEIAGETGMEYARRPVADLAGLLPWDDEQLTRAILYHEIFAGPVALRDPLNTDTRR